VFSPLKSLSSLGRGVNQTPLGAGFAKSGYFSQSHETSYAGNAENDG